MGQPTHPKAIRRRRKRRLERVKARRRTRIAEGSRKRSAGKAQSPSRS